MDVLQREVDTWTAPVASTLQEQSWRVPDLPVEGFQAGAWAAGDHQPKSEKGLEQLRPSNVGDLPNRLSATTTSCQERAAEDASPAMARLCACRDNDASPDAVAELRALYVATASWSSGLGGRLLDEGFARMPQPVQVLWTLQGNTRARGFYERRGFQLDGAHRVRQLGGSADEVHYRRVRPAVAS